MVVRILGVGSGDEAELELIRPREERLASPLGELVGVVFELGGDHSAALRLDLLAVVNAGDLGVKLVQRLDGEESLGALAVRHAVELVPRYEHDPAAHVPLAVAVSNLGGVGVPGAERIRVVAKVFALLGEHLLRIVKVARGGLLAELVDAVDVLLVVRDRVLRRLGHREQVEGTLGSLVHD